MKGLIGLFAAAALMVISCATVEKQQAVWDKSYGGTDKSYDTELLQLREIIAPGFKHQNLMMKQPEKR